MSGHSIKILVILFILISACSVLNASPPGVVETNAPMGAFTLSPSGMVAGNLAKAVKGTEANTVSAGATTQSLRPPAIYSGSWYNPDRDGEGFEFQVLDNGDFLIIFYTYPGPTDDAQARQSFILGVGTIQGTVATVENAYRSHGPVFGEDFNKDELRLVTWGSFRVEFLDENRARVEYDGADGSGATNVIRLTWIADPNAEGPLSSGISGMWFNPETDGQGWFVEILDDTQALVYFFTYDENGNQAWSLGVGVITGKSIIVSEMQSGIGTRFGDEFVSEDVVRVPSAPLILEFLSCENGSVSVLEPDGTVGLFYPVVRLSNLMGHTCTGFTNNPGTRPDGRRFFFVATSESDSEYFRQLGISWQTSTQYIFKIDIDSREAAEVDSNHSPSYASSTIYSYTVDDRYFVREQYGTQHSLNEYDPLTLGYRSGFRVHRGLDSRCSAVTSTSYFYRVKVDPDPFFGDTGGEFMRLDLDGSTGGGNGVELDVPCYLNLQSSNGILYDAIYWHEYEGTTAAIGLYTRDPVSGVATTMNEFFQPDADQFVSYGYTFHFDGDTIFIVRAISAGGFQVLRYVHGVDSLPVSIYVSGPEIPEDFYPHYRDADEGYVAVGSGSGLIVILDTINETVELLDLETGIYDMSFLHVKD